MILGENSTILGKISVIFSQIGKVNLFNWDFSKNWELFKVNWDIFSANWEKNWYPNLDPVLFSREKALIMLRQYYMLYYARRQKFSLTVNYM